jgi:hypothetical protein
VLIRAKSLQRVQSIPLGLGQESIRRGQYLGSHDQAAELHNKKVLSQLQFQPGDKYYKLQGHQ